MAAEIFMLIGAIIFLGFAAQALFQRTKVPDVLLLMAFGILIGPLNLVGTLTGGATAINTELFAGFAPIVGAIALIIILFEGGFNLDIFRAFTELSTATWFATLTFALTAALTAAVLLPFGWPPLHGLLLGVVIGGTSSATVISLLSKSSASEETKTLLSLESALTDALCVISAVVTIELIRAADVSLNSTATLLFGQFSIAAVIAVAVSVAWIKLLQRFKEIPFSYMLSIAVIFLMYGFVESVGGNGTVSVLIFGLLLGNWNHLTKRFNLGDEIVAFEKTFRSFQAEVTFFVRTFFFVYIGMVFDISALAGSTAALLPIAAVLAVLGIARLAGTRALLFFNSQLSGDRRLIFSMMPRDLAAAVLATLPQSRGIGIPMISEIVFLTILLTNIATAFGFYESERGAASVAGEAGDSGKKPRILKQS
ncbi:MAG: cation:proton antiporter [Candidatus Micrarchaeia archaeon]|jgi:cell volume regulation protein A